MTVKLLTEHHLEFLSLKGCCRGWSESTLVEMSNCWKSHVTAQIISCFLSNMICNWSVIHRKFKSVPYPVAAKSCVSGVKSCVRNSLFPYLKANSIFIKIL